MDALLSDLLSAVDSSPHHLNREIIISAWNFAALAHTGQKRLSGEPFIIHPTTVAKTIISWGLDTDSVVAALLHDTIENGGATRADIVTQFGEPAALLVDGVTKVTHIRLTNSVEEQFAENLRKMLLVMAHDLRVVIIKLADRLHNMQTLGYLPPAKQQANAKETLEIYAPLAERLGMGNIKGELEDLSFPFVYPSEFTRLTRLTKQLYSENQSYIQKFQRQLLILLKPQLPEAKINTRFKHLYSLWRKLQRPEINGDINKIYDLSAARVLVDSVEHCYLALGLIHSAYRPVPYLGVSDFIATPKPNGYRSLHTKVFGPEGRIVEIQIRTFAMHEQAEMGIAAHWQYSQAKSAGMSDSKLETGQVKASMDKLAWVKQLMTWQNQIADNSEYLRTLKFDALQHRIMVFSPKGDVYDLPKGSTPIDFAFAVHTDIGTQAVGAIVNGKAVTLDHHLANGDVVAIKTNPKNKVPNSKWLDFVVTTSARHSISKAVNIRLSHPS